MQCKSYSAKIHNKMSPYLHQSVSMKPNDKVTSDNDKDSSWPKGIIHMAGDSIVSGYSKACDLKSTELP